MRLPHSLLLSSIAISTLAVACVAAPRRSSNDDDEDGDTTGSNGSNGSNGAGASGGSGGSGGAGGSSTTTTTTTGSTTTTGGGTCTHPNMTFSTPACGSCVENFCCSSLQVCDGSTQCLEALDCISNCTDQPCADACAESNPTGTDQLLTLDGCMTDMCDAQCAAG